MGNSHHAKCPKQGCVTQVIRIVSSNIHKNGEGAFPGYKAEIYMPDGYLLDQVTSVNFECN